MSSAFNHRPKDGDMHTSLFLIILVGGLAWSHHELISKAETIILFNFLTMCGIFVLTKSFRVYKRIRRWKQLRSPELALIDKMSGLEFEKYAAKLLIKQGYKHVNLTEKFDLGVDIIAEKDGLRYGIQVKRYSGLVKASAVRQAVTALKSYKCERAMVITNSTFSKVARLLAESNDCILIDRTGLKLGAS